MNPLHHTRMSPLQSLLSRPAVLALGLIIAVAALYLPWLGLNDLMHEETRRAVIARTMMDSGNYLVPYLGERIYLNKPQFFNWMIAAFSAPAGGVSEFTARLPTVVSLAALAVLMVFTAGRHLDARAQWLLGIGVIVTGEIMQKSVLGNVDTAFTLSVSASLWIWFALDERGRRGLALWLPPAVLVGISFLVKREPALVFYYLGIGAFLLSQWRFGELFRPPHLIAAAVTLALVGLWLVPVTYQAGLGTVIANFNQEVLSRGLSPSPAAYVEHFLLYPVEILVAALPTSVLLIALAWPTVRRAVHRRHGRLFVFAVIVVVVNLPIYWLRADVAVRYFMPMMPTMVAIAAMVFDTLLAQGREWPRSTRWTLYGLALFLAVLMAVLGGAMIVLSIPGAFPDIAGPIVPWPLMMALGAATLVVLGHTLWRHRSDLAVVAFVAILGAGLALRVGDLGFRIPHEAARIVAENDDVPAIVGRIEAELPPGVEHVQAIGRMPHALWFYDRAGIVVPAARFEREGEPASRYVLIWSEPGPAPQWASLPTEPVARIPYEDDDFLLMRLPDGGAQ